MVEPVFHPETSFFLMASVPPPRSANHGLFTALRRWWIAAVLGLGPVLAVGSARGQSTSAPTPPPAAEGTTLFSNAVAAFEHGDYQGAISAIDTLVKLIPADLPPADAAKLNTQLEPIFFDRGAAYFNLKQYPEAITALKDYLARYPKGARTTSVLFSLGQASYLSQDYHAAARSFAALESTPAFREQALLLEGLSHKELGEDAAAITALEKLLVNGIKSPTAARGAMQLVVLYSRQKQPDKALAMLANIQANLDQLENVVELNAVALTQGDAFLGNNANKEALACYRVVMTRERVIAIEHDRIASLQNRQEANQAAARANPKEASQLLQANRQLLDSIAEDQQLLDNFAKLPTIYPKVLFRMGRALYQMGQPWEAAVAYQDSADRAQDPADREAALFGLITAEVDVHQPVLAQAECKTYLQAFPRGENASTVGYLLGASALQDNDPKDAEKYFGQMLAGQPAGTLREEMEFLLANAQFAQGKYDEARTAYEHYRKDFPQGTHFEESVYRAALTSLFGGDYDGASKHLADYLSQFPQGSFVSDAKYRLDVCRYAANKYDEVIADTRAWLQQYPGDAQQGEVESLLADAYAATGKADDALAAYQASYKTAATDEVLNYSLMEAGKILQKRGDWEADAAMFKEFVRQHPDHPTVPAALAQIGRAEVKEGKIDEAKQFLAETLKKYIDDPHRDSVEQILDQLAALCVKKKPAAAAPAPPAGLPAALAAASSPAPAATPAPAPGAELDTLLGASLADRSPTARARVLYAKAQLARLLRQNAEVERDLLAIAAQFKPGVLSPTILGLVGDALVSSGKPDAAVPFYQTLMDDYPKDPNVDFAYAGLGEVAFQNKQYDKALEYFGDGTDKIAANQKLKELTVGQAKTLLALNRLVEARKLFEQAASTREWRGETTAYCVYSLGQIEAKQGHWAEANAYYQRVFVAYQRFLPWVAKAYLGSADSLEKLGKKEDAVKTYQEMLRNTKLADFAEASEARQRLQALGAS